MTREFSEALNQKTLNGMFTYHRPNDEQKAIYMRIRLEARHLAGTLNVALPNCPEKVQAIERLSETVMIANAAVARHWPPEERESEEYQEAPEQ